MSEMRTFRLDKLVRDKIVQSTEEIGGSAEYRILEKEELTGALLYKTGEELAEGEEELAKSGKIPIDELADARQAIEDLAQSQGYTLTELHAQQYDKKRKVGGFMAGIFVETVTVPADNEIAEYYASHPDRFPEIK